MGKRKPDNEKVKVVTISLKNDQYMWLMDQKKFNAKFNLSGFVNDCLIELRRKLDNNKDIPEVKSK